MQSASRPGRINSAGSRFLLNNAAIGDRRLGPVLVVLAGSMPFTYGWPRPTLVLPSQYPQWPQERRRAVVVHELAHVERRDWFVQCLAQFVSAVFWFNPLMHILTRTMAFDAEIACDDAVLRSGVPAAEYTRQLVDIVRELSTVRKPAPVAVAMASSTSHLKSRVASALDEGAPRTALKRRTAVLLAILPAVIVALPLSRRSDSGEALFVAPKVATDNQPSISPEPGRRHVDIYRQLAERQRKQLGSGEYGAGQSVVQGRPEGLD